MALLGVPFTHTFLLTDVWYDWRMATGRLLRNDSRNFPHNSELKPEKMFERPNPIPSWWFQPI